MTASSYPQNYQNSYSSFSEQPKKITVGKDYGTLAGVRAIIFKHVRLPMSTKFSGFILSLSRPISPRRNIQLGKEYRTLAGHDAKP